MLSALSASSVFPLAASTDTREAESQPDDKDQAHDDGGDYGCCTHFSFTSWGPLVLAACSQKLKPRVTASINQMM
jgi:hypothetical protein